MWDGGLPEKQDEYLKMNEKMKKLQLTRKVQSNEDEEKRSSKKNFLWDETRLTRLWAASHSSFALLSSFWKASWCCCAAYCM